MKLIPLSKKEAQELEDTTNRIENAIYSPLLSKSERVILFDTMCNIQGWYHKHGLRPAYVKEQWKKLTELLGFKPTYYVTHSYRNALWAFKWEDQPVLIYKDQRGLGIQILKQFPKKLIKKFLQELEQTLA